MPGAAARASQPCGSAVRRSTGSPCGCPGRGAPPRSARSSAPTRGEVVYSSAGHPPPILVHADRTAVICSTVLRPHLWGWRSTGPAPRRTPPLPPRATLLLYTDGLVERRREAIDEGIARAADVMEDNGATTLDDMAKMIMSGLAPTTAIRTTWRLLLYRQPAPLELDMIRRRRGARTQPGRAARLADPGRGEGRSDVGRADRHRRGACQRYRARPSTFNGWRGGLGHVACLCSGGPPACHGGRHRLLESTGRGRASGARYRTHAGADA